MYKKEYNCLSFYARKKNKDNFGIFERFPTNITFYFFHFLFRFLLT